MLHRRPRLAIGALTTAGVLIALGAVRAGDVRWRRAQTLGDPEARAASVAFILSEYVHEAFAADDASLRQLTVHARRPGPLLLSAFQPTSAPPLVVAVSLDDVLTGWWREVERSAVFLVLVGLLLAATLVVLFRRIDAKARALEATSERLAEALAREQRARREVQDASALKDEFLMMVSHELRTPLTSIYGWARLLLGGQLGPEQQRQALGTIERNARSQTRLIEDLLDVSRAMGGQLRLDLQPVQIPDLIAAATDAVQPTATAKHIRVDTIIDPQAATTIDADPERLQQVVWNLLSNAIKFTPEGGRVRVHVGALDHQVAIEVTDSGRGIEPAFLPHVFEPFRQAERGTTRRHGGLGLGLAIVRHLAELHGGTVAAESAGEGSGATFRVTLPISHAHDVTRSSDSWPADSH